MIDLVSPIARNTNSKLLHPRFRAALSELEKDLTAAEIPLFVFEGVRTPVRQAYLYAQGRTSPGSIVTYARPWSSYHQYGLAVDMVFGGPGKWTWVEPKKGMWKKFHDLARKRGLAPLDFETPHIQIVGTSSNALSQGKYPEGGDESWAETLASMIAAWGGEPKAPPAPPIAERPPIA
jgi:peptidoglycan L-alanyl-D-glutamate endopeptidase CwlK